MPAFPVDEEGHLRDQIQYEQEGPAVAGSTASHLGRSVFGHGDSKAPTVRLSRLIATLSPNLPNESVAMNTCGGGGFYAPRSASPIRRYC